MNQEELHDLIVKQQPNICQIVDSFLILGSPLQQDCLLHVDL